MREIHALPNRKFRPIPSGNAALLALIKPIAHWQFDETGTTTTVADYHSASDLTWSVTDTATGALYKADGSGAGGSRVSPSSTASRTNYLLQSQTFDNATWTKYQLSVSADVITAPDGSSTADGLVPNNGAVRHAVMQDVTLTTGTYTWSMYAKAGSVDCFIMVNVTNSADARFDLAAGTVLSTANCTASISSVGSGWYRCVMTYSASAGTNEHHCYTTTDVTNPVWTGDGVTVGTYVWGGQIEDSASVTDYIPTTTVPVTASTAVAQYAVGSSTSTQRERLRGNVSMRWVGDFSSIAGTQTLLAHGSTGSDGTAANNYLWRVAVVNGAVQVYWEYGSGTDVTITSPVVVTIGRHVIGVRRRDVRSVTIPDLVFTDVFVDGRLVHSDARASSQMPSGTEGSAGSWALGTDVGVSNSALATHYDCQIVGYAMADDWFRAGARAALRTFDEAKLLSTTRPGRYSVYHRVLLEDPEVFGGHGLGLDQSMVDLDALTGSWTGHGRSFLEEVQWSDDVDAAGASAAFTLSRDIFGWSTAPGMTNASPVAASSGINLLQVARRIKIETAVVPEGREYEDLDAFDWATKFDGFISAIDWTNDPIQVQCRDRIAPLQWTICEPLASKAYREAQYGDDSSPVELETVLQEIIDDHADVGAETLRGGKPTVYCPVSPSFGMRKRSIGFDPIQTVLKSKTDQIGWQIRYVWNDDVKDFLLTLSEPDRAVSVVLRTFDPDVYDELRSVAVDEANIRNFCHVVYGDVADTDNLAVAKRKRASASNTASIEKYGRRYCQVAEEVTSDVDTLAEAEALAEAVVADLAEPKVSIEMVLPTWPQAELSDYYAVSPDDRHFSAVQNLAVIGYSHSLNAQGGTTVIKLRGQPVAQYNRYMSILSQPGAGGAPFRAPETPSTVSIAAGPRSAEVTFDYPTAARSSQFDQAEIHLGTAPGFTASSATLVKAVRGNRTVLENLPLEKKYAQVIFRDRNNNVTEPIETSFFPNISERDLPASFRRRQYWMYQYGASGADPLAVGTGTPVVTGAGSPAALTIGNEVYYRRSTGTTSGDISAVRTDVPHRGISSVNSNTVSFYCRWATSNISSETTSRMAFVGLTARSTVDVASSRGAVPSQQGNSFGFFVEEEDVYAIVSDGTAQTSELIYSITAGAGSEAHEFTAGYDTDSGYFWFQVDDGDFVFIDTNKPPMDADVYALVGTRTAAAAAKANMFAHFAVNY